MIVVPATITLVRTNRTVPPAHLDSGSVPAVIVPRAWEGRGHSGYAESLGLGGAVLAGDLSDVLTAPREGSRRADAAITAVPYGAAPLLDGETLLESRGLGGARGAYSQSIAALYSQGAPGGGGGGAGAPAGNTGSRAKSSTVSPSSPPTSPIIEPGGTNCDAGDGLGDANGNGGYGGGESVPIPEPPAALGAVMACLWAARGVVLQLTRRAKAIGQRA